VITDPAARPHPFLFEHHPERNLRSFFRTLWGTLTPTRFWKSLSPTQPSRPNRLVAYAVICSVLTMLVAVGLWYADARADWSNPGSYRWRYVNGFLVTPNAGATSLAEKWEIASKSWSFHRDLRVVLLFTILWVIWPWMTLLSLAVFQVSARRAKIQDVHVLRSVVYSFDEGAWLGLLVAAAELGSLLLPRSVGLPDEGSIRFAFFAMLSIAFFRMWRAYRFYLKFDHPFLTVLAAAAMSTLLGLIFFVDLERWIITR
jgi:hypothetical protein